jgi:hypothetical protein
MVVSRRQANEGPELMLRALGSCGIAVVGYFVTGAGGGHGFNGIGFNGTTGLHVGSAGGLTGTVTFGGAGTGAAGSGTGAAGSGAGAGPPPAVPPPVPPDPPVLPPVLPPVPEPAGVDPVVPPPEPEELLFEDPPPPAGVPPPEEPPLLVVDPGCCVPAGVAPTVEPGVARVLSLAPIAGLGEAGALAYVVPKPDGAGTGAVVLPTSGMSATGMPAA